MSEGRRSRSFGEKKALEPRGCSGGNYLATFFSADSLLKGLLIDLGLTDTAKVLEEESCRRLQLSFSSLSTKTDGVCNAAADTRVMHVANYAHGHNSTGSTNKTAKKLLRRNNNNNKSNGENSEQSSAVQPSEGGVSESKIDIPPIDTARTFLFRALVHSATAGERAEETEKNGVLDELCSIAVSPIKRDSGKTSTITTDASSGRKTTSLSFLLQKLFKVLLIDTNNASLAEQKWNETTEKSEHDAQFFATIPVEWIPLMEVFFAYVEVLWSQVCLSEVVSLADFTVKGWFHNQQRVLEQVSLLQEKVHRLLLEAHQLERFSPYNEEPAAQKEGKNNGTALPSSEIDNSCFMSGFNSALDVRSLAENLFKGVSALFSRSDPTYRENIEEVSTWIMTQCSYHVQHDGKSHFEQLRDKEPISADEETGTAFLEECDNNGHASLARNSWNMIIGAVRQALLADGVESSKETSEIMTPQPQADFKLLLAQTSFRIYFFSWVLGSAAQFVEILRQHCHVNAEEKKGRGVKTGGRNKKKSEGALVRPSMVNAVLGFWYHCCAIQISDRITAFNVISDDHSVCDTPQHSVQEGGKNQVQLPLSLRCNQLSEEELNLGRSFVNILKTAAYEFLVGNVTILKPLHLSIVESNLPRMKSVVASSLSVAADKMRDMLTSRIADDKRGYIQTVLLDTLATGKRVRLNQVCESRHATLLHLLKKAFCDTRLLLDLQNELLPVDMQLKAMENASALTLLQNKKDDFSVGMGSTNRKCWEQSRRARIASNESTLIRSSEENLPNTGGVSSGMEDQQQRLSENSAVGRYLTHNTEVVAESTDPAGNQPTFVHPQLTGDRTSSYINEQSEETAQIGSDDDNYAVSSTDNNLDRSGDVLLDEVQIVSVTPCGSLMAFLTTKGRLVVFALRVAKKLSCNVAVEEPQETFCERLILNANILNEPNNVPHWYEHLESFLAFSPSGNFLLCSVQNAPPFVPEGEEANRPCPSTMGKVFIYSLHCTEDDNCGVDCNDSDRLYGVFKIHNTLITVARWVDPRFWRTNYLHSGVCPLEKDAPGWKREAYRRLSALQCLSTGRDNLILRWLPADGSIIQRIATLPVFDILVSPLMQAFYTINQAGQLSMYDAWNEHDIEGPDDNTVFVSQRGLPVSLSVVRTFNETREERLRNKSAAPLKDGEKQEEFFVGARTICFDRQCVGQGDAENESVIARLSKAMQKKRLPAGTESKEGDHLGRCMVQTVLHQETDHFIARMKDFVMLSSGSGDENDDNDSSSNKRKKKSTDVGGYGSRTSIYEYKETAAGASPFLMLRRLHTESDAKKNFTSYSNAARQNRSFHKGESVFYRTGSRLVFEEVSRLLCHTAGIWTLESDKQYAPPPHAYHLLSMAASGDPVWNDGDERCLSTCADSYYSFYERFCGAQFAHSYSYYTDVYKRHWKRDAGDSSGRNSISLLGIDGTQEKNNALRNCNKLRKKTVLASVPRNGRYLCIMASVGPIRAVVPYNRPLEYSPGIYACVIFDVLYGTVVRVIPVCPILPRESLTENGISFFHSKTRRAPIYMLPCSMTVVSRSRRQKLARKSHGVCEHALASNHMVDFCSFEEDEEEKKEGGGAMELGFNYYRSCKSDYNDDDDEDDSDNDGSDSIVVLAVGALHSTTYVFDALTGSRIKVVNLRKQDRMQNVATTTETRPPSKRARCSYISLGELGSEGALHINGEAGEDRDRNNFDDVGDSGDSDSSSVLSESLSPCSREQHSNHRREVLCQLAGAFGMDRMLGALMELLCVVPFPFSLLSGTLHDGDVRELQKKQSVAKCLQETCGGFCAMAAGGNCGTTTPSAPLLSCPSFWGQLRAAAGGVGARGESATCTRHPAGAAAAPSSVVCGDVPFAFAGTPVVARLTDENVPAGEVAGVQATFARRVRKRLRCGVVNSVALLCDRVGGGVYVFSSDEYGGLFVTGDVITPKV